MKKNIFDTDIQMIDLDSIGNLDVNYNDFSSPNPELASDLEMAMKETQVFSADEIEAALMKEADLLQSDAMGDTRVIDMDNMDMTQVFEFDASKLDSPYSALVDDSGEENVSNETLNEGGREEALEQAQSDYISTKGEEDDWEFEDTDEAESYKETENSEEGLEDTDSEEVYEESSDEADNDTEEYTQEVEEYSEEETEDVNEEVNDEDSQESYEDEQEEDSEDEESDETEEDSDEEDEEKDSQKKAVAAGKKKNDNGKKKGKPDKNSKPDKNDKGVHKKKGSDQKGGKGNKKVAAASNEDKKKKKGFAAIFSQMGIVEYIGVAMLLAVAVLLVILSSKLINNNNNKKNVEQFASIGILYENIDEIGNEGIKAIGEKASLDSITPTEEVVTDPVKDDTKPEEIDKPVKNTAPISVNFSSIEKDLKIKFTDKNTGKLITGIRFEVSAKGPGGKEYTWSDTDMDGVIYVDKLTPGNYEVVVLSTDEYDFPETPTTVKVQDTVVYQVINVIDEAVDMSQVNLAQEDNQVKDVDQGTALQDTVGYVESSATPVSGADGFVKINKSDIKDPKTLASAYEWGGFRRVDVSKELVVGATDKLTVSLDEGQTVEWTGGNDCVTVDNEGNITAIKAGSASLNATIKGADGNNIRVDVFNITVTEQAAENPNPADPANPEEPANPDDGVIHVTGITLKDAETSVGKTVPVYFEIQPADAANKKVIWKSSDESIATVDETGIVTGVKAGEVTITATCEDGNKSASAKVTVKAALNLTLSVKNSEGNDIQDITLYVGDSYQIVSKVDGAVNDFGVTYSSSNNAVTVSDTGVINAVTAGSSEVSVITNEKSGSGEQLVKKFTVTVKNNPMNDTTTKLMYYSEAEKKDVEVYIKNAEGNYVEAKWADYYKDGVEFYIKGSVTYKYTGWQTIDGNVYYFDSNGNKVTGEQVIGGAKYTFASDGSLVNSNGVRGIDVSGYNGTIDWTAVKNSGISFVIIRCGFRGYTKGGLVLDSKYQSYIQGATSAGLKVGLYLFSQALNESEAVEEASLCVNLAQGYKISYPIFIDSEYANGSRSGRADKLDKGTRTAVCKAFCETIKSAGYTPGIYASKTWFYDKLDVNQLSSYKIWLAHYTGQTDYNGRYDIWQHTDKGSVNGIKGNVDLDISYLGY